MRLNLVYIILLFFNFSCKKDVIDTEFKSLDKNYINSSIGAFIEYNVQEIIYDDFKNTIDTQRYQLKEVNESIFTDNLGRKSLRIDRYTRLNDTIDWSYLNTWYNSFDVQSIQRVENNVRKTVLSFPVTFDAVWNSNVSNMDYVNNVFYTSIHKPYTTNNIKFDSTLSIESVTTINSFKERAYKEIYAKNVGLVYKNLVFIDKIGLLQRGKRMVYKLVKHVP